MIEKIINAISKRTDAHEFFIKTAAYAIMSNNLGEFIEIPITNKTLKPNIFVLLIGPPHASRKSTVLGYIKKLSLIHKVPTDVTYQYFLQVLELQSVSWQCIDEVSELLQQYLKSQNERHKQMVRAYLMLFNNEALERGTKSGGEILIEDTFFNFVGATTTTSAFTYLTDHNSINSGFIPRFLMPVIDESELKRETMKYITSNTDLDDILNQFKDWRDMLDASKVNRIRIFFNQDGFEAIDDFEYRMAKKLRESILIPIVSRYTDYVFKLSALHELDSELESGKMVPRKLMVSLASINKAIAYISDLLVKLQREFSAYTDYNNFTIAYQRVITAIQKGKHVESDIYRSAHTDAQTTRKILETLVKQDKIYIMEPKGKKGKKRYYIKP